MVEIGSGVDIVDSSHDPEVLYHVVMLLHSNKCCYKSYLFWFVFICLCLDVSEGSNSVFKAQCGIETHILSFEIIARKNWLRAWFALFSVSAIWMLVFMELLVNTHRSFSDYVVYLCCTGHLQSKHVYCLMNPTA